MPAFIFRRLRFYRNTEKSLEDCILTEAYIKIFMIYLRVSHIGLQEWNGEAGMDEGVVGRLLSTFLVPFVF